MANRSFIRDVLQALQEIDEAFLDVAWSDPKEMHTALSKLWRIVGGLEAVAMRRASSADYEEYVNNVVLPRAKRTSEKYAELVPTQRTDKDGVPW